MLYLLDLAFSTIERTGGKTKIYLDACVHKVYVKLATYLRARA